MKLINRRLLRVFLEDRGMSHRELARAVGCSNSFIDHLTAGRKDTCRPDLAAAIERVLRCPPGVLFVPNPPISSVRKHARRGTRAGKSKAAA